MPSMPGFPVLKSGKIPAPITGLLNSAIGSLWGMVFPGSNWGIYETGSTEARVQFDSIVEVGLNGSSEASTYKLESGSFASYNKVVNPDAFIVRATKEGTATQRAYILDWAKANAGLPTKFDIVMPEKTYTGFTVVEYRLVRNASTSVGMITIDFMIQEVREAVAIYSSSTIADPNNVPSQPMQRVQTSEQFPLPNPPENIEW